MSLEKDSEKGLEAQQFLNNPVYIEAVRALRSTIHTAWENAPIRDVEGQHELKLMLKLLNDLEANIKRVVNDGKIAQIEIERQKKPLLNIFKRA
jgi:hypothetical protein